MITRRLFGRCFCGAIKFEVADEFEYSAYCHCSNCRRTTGSAFKLFAGIQRAKFRLMGVGFSSMLRPFGQPSTSSSAPRRRGLRLPLTFHNSRDTR